MVNLSFDRVFHGITKDTNFINKLTTPNELSGLLILALVALRQLKKDGGFRDISVAKVRKSMNIMHTVNAFLDDKCDIDQTSQIMSYQLFMCTMSMEFLPREVRNH